jgi:chemotaxis protein methyltransferase CheR
LSTLAAMPAKSSNATATRPIAGVFSPELTEQEFNLLRQFFYKEIGASLSNEKKALMIGRLCRRLEALGFTTFSQYYQLISNPAETAERQKAIDLITTNETYFFREAEQFTILRDQVLATHSRAQPFRLWCAASSTGEEPYSLAMLLDHHRGTAPWSLMASDISSRALSTAKRGLYQMSRIEGIPRDYLKRYCLKGQGDYDNHLLIERGLRERVDYRQINLTQLPPNLGQFDAVFIRNVIIYFDAATKLAVLSAVVRHLVPGGMLFLGHSESLQGMDLPLEPVAPATYRKRNAIS